MENLNEQISRIRSMMGLITEEEKIIQNEEEFVELVKNNGFELINDPAIAKEYNFTLNLYDYIYINKETNAYLYKLKKVDSPESAKVFLGVKGWTNPKTNETIKSSWISGRFPVYPINYNDYLNLPKVDKVYDLPSIIRDLDSIRNLYYGFVEKDEKTGKLISVETKEILDDNYVNVLKNMISERMVKNMENIEKLTIPEDKTTQIKSEKFDNTFNNIYDYHKFVEDEAKTLELY